MHSKKNWHTHIIAYLWIAIGVSSSVTLFNMFFSRIDPLTFILERFLLPFVLEILILLVLKRLIRANAKVTPYYIVIGTQAIVTILFVVHYPVFYVMLPLFLMPVLISVFFLNLKLIDFAFILALSVFIGMKLLFPPLRLCQLLN